MNKEEWFQLLNDNFDNIKGLVETYHPYYLDRHLQTISGNPEYGTEKSEQLTYLENHITAPRAEIARQQVLKTIKIEKPDLYSQDIEYLIRILNGTYFGIPESLSAHALPGFGVLCDLCSDFPNEEI